MFSNQSVGGEHAILDPSYISYEGGDCEKKADSLNKIKY